jgi:hypothetical protein
LVPVRGAGRYRALRLAGELGAPGGHRQAEVNCPDDYQKTLGGGGTSTGDRTYQWASRPRLGADWTVIAHNTGSIGATIYAWVICAYGSGTT